MNNFTEKFSLYQTMNTMGAADMKYFTMADKHYLAVANSWNQERIKGTEKASPIHTLFHR